MNRSFSVFLLVEEGPPNFSKISLRGCEFFLIIPEKTTLEKIINKRFGYFSLPFGTKISDLLKGFAWR
ncbi:MAG: hypothetical protein HQM08_16835 [Candidatus Riflebacteria bacterium]|nr:hypothetical protein [Candidatus Riflebacteria bacterium]